MAGDLPPLDREQQKAMSRPAHSRIGIVAGAGTGKTVTLVGRAAYARKYGQNRNGTVICLSYTNKASEELGRRLKRLLDRPKCVQSFASLERQHPGITSRFWNGTLHSFAKSVIEELTTPQVWKDKLSERDRARLGGISEMYERFSRQNGRIWNILEERDAARLWEQTITEDPALGRHFHDTWKRKREDVYGAWSGRQAALMVGHPVPIAVPHMTEAQAKLRDWHHFDITELEQHAGALYHEAKGRSGYIDYNDLLTLSAAALTHLPELREYYRESLTHVLMDESQDMSFLDYVFMKSLPCFLPEGDETVGFTLIGDVRQEIYGFKGGQPGIFAMLLGVGWATEVCYLTINYRSGPEIISLASSIVQNPMLYTAYESDPLVAMQAAHNAKTAAVEWTVLGKGEERASSYLPAVIRHALTLDMKSRVILVRSNWMKRDVEEVLANIPGSRDKFEISTIHSAKGKEWDHVILVGVGRNKFPVAPAFWNTKEENIRSESRLLYVAVTRARRRLEVFEAENGLFYPALYQVS